MIPDVPIKQSDSTSMPTRIIAVVLTEMPLPLSPTEKLSISTVDPFSALTCICPSDNYEVLVINGHQLNQRTHEMLQRAERIYSGIIDITGDAINPGILY
jgi:hypothetical protein